MSAADYDYERIGQLAKEMGQSVETLVALTTPNDPFYITPGRRAGAEWFAKVWRELGCGPGIHLRAIHYRLLSHVNGYVGTDGKPYLNSDRCYARLNYTSQDARYLGLVPEDHFDDRRNDEPIEYLVDRQTSAWAYTGEIDRGDTIYKLEVYRSLPDFPDYHFTPPFINQRYHVELWCEKTTMNEILLSLAQQYHCNVVTASGEISITHCRRLIQRALASERPVRILYISDFDPAGRSIPVACARKLEFFIQRDALDLDVQLRPIVLTPEQCDHYRLPRTPIKDEFRAERFEMQYGEGATELDALEALHPGELRRILEQEILRYYDTDLSDSVEDKADEFRDQLVDLRREIIERYGDERDAIEDEHGEIVDRCNEMLEQFQQQFDEVEERYTDLQDRIATQCVMRDRLPATLIGQNRKTVMRMTICYSIVSAITSIRLNDTKNIRANRLPNEYRRKGENVSMLGPERSAPPPKPMIEKKEARSAGVRGDYVAGFEFECSQDRNVTRALEFHDRR